MNRRVLIGTTLPEGMSLRGDDLTLVIPRGGWREVSIREALLGLLRFPHIYCPDLLVPKPEPRFIGQNEIVAGPEGIPTDRTAFLAAFAPLIASSNLQVVVNALDQAENLGNPDYAICLYCMGEYAKQGLSSHIKAKHPDSYEEWRQLMGREMSRGLKTAQGLVGLLESRQKPASAQPGPGDLTDDDLDEQAEAAREKAEQEKAEQDARDLDDDLDLSGDGKKPGDDETGGDDDAATE